MDCHANGLLDPFVTLLEVHKLMYFMQAAGEPLKLRFAKAPYGPCAENLRHVLHAVEGHFISGYAAPCTRSGELWADTAVREFEAEVAVGLEQAGRVDAVEDEVLGVKPPAARA